MKWFQLLSMTCICGQKKQFAGNNRRQALGLAGHAGWKFRAIGDLCPACAKEFENHPVRKYAGCKAV